MFENWYKPVVTEALKITEDYFPATESPSTGSYDIMMDVLPISGGDRQEYVIENLHDVTFDELNAHSDAFTDKFFDAIKSGETYVRANFTVFRIDQFSAFDIYFKRIK